MSLPFTTITADTDLQAISGPLGEMCAAMDERSSVADDYAQPSLVNISAGTDIQAVEFWSLMQTRIELICPVFLDHEAAINGASAFTYQTIARMRQLAGLHADGFRRVTAYDPAINDWTDPNDPMYSSHGPIQAGDIIGPWLYQDIEACLSVLRWTVRAIVYGELEINQSEWRSRSSGPDTWYTDYDDHCEEARTIMIAGWAAGSWGAVQTTDEAGYEVGSVFGRGQYWYYANQSRKQIRPAGKVRFTSLPCAVDVVLQLSGEDYDSLGAGANGMIIMDTWAALDPPVELRGGDVDGAAWLGGYDTAPVTWNGCPPTPYSTDSIGMSSSLYFVQKWEFTNA